MNAQHPQSTTPASNRIRFEVEEAEAGERLDVVVAAFAGITRAQARRWIDAGAVELAGEAAAKRVRSGLVVALGDVIVALPPEPLAASALPEAIPLAVVYEDEDLIAIDKPAGMVVHPGPGHASGTLVNALLHHCASLAQVGGVLRPGIVHRLDRGTSGVMVAAKNDAAHLALSEQFRSHSLERIYHALARGRPGAGEGRIEAAIGRHPRDRKRMSTETRMGREAVTNWRIAKRYDASQRVLLEIRPETGRTHQIRVHLASIGLPVAGDPVYGRGRGSKRELELARPALHASVLAVDHPRSGERLRFEAPLAPELIDLLAALDGAEKRS